ncbi:MAG: dipeptidase [Clostridia bacterium]|nr:dipeptidase [Clostridia bacterium]
MFIDAHCDTASVLLDSKKVLKKNDLHLDLTRMPKGYTQIFAAFIDPKYHGTPMERAEAIINKLKAEIEKKTNKIELCLDNDMRLEALASGNSAAFISLEGGEPIKCVEDVGRLYDMGVRIVSLTWNGKNQLAGGVDSDGRVTELGRKVIEEFCKKGIIVDVSHLNEQSFWDVMRVTSWPVIATHSCSKSVFNHKRNLTDEQFSAIVSRGGVVGINFYPKFLNGRKKAYIKNIIKHIDHFLKLGGENHIGLGSDFDGVDCLPQDLCGVEGMHTLKEAFKEHGYSDELIEKICCGNFERILRLL